METLNESYLADGEHRCSQMIKLLEEGMQQNKASRLSFGGAANLTCFEYRV